MKSLTLLILVMFCSLLSVHAQNNIYVGTARFDANYSWTFKINGGWIQGDGFVTFAKRSGGGMLLISVKEFEGDLKGDLYIYLKDGNAIRCIDRNIKDNVNNYTMAVYNLTMSEVELLKNSDIEDIRFSVYKYPYGSKNYTMSNNYTFFGDRNNIQTNSTSIDIYILMNK